MDDATACAQDLIVAIFRLAVADTLGVAYGHDGPGPVRRTVPRQCSDADDFVDSLWAEHLADISGLSTGAIRRELSRRRRHLGLVGSSESGGS